MRFVYGFATEEAFKSRRLEHLKSSTYGSQLNKFRMKVALAQGAPSFTEPLKSFAIFDYKGAIWPASTDESFHAFGNREIQRIINHFKPVIDNEEEAIRKENQWPLLRLFIFNNDKNLFFVHPTDQRSFGARAVPRNESR